jgi:hypothetical protein
MAKTLDFEKLKVLENEMAIALRPAATVGDAAQIFCSRLYESWNENLVLVRLYLTMPYGELPSFQTEFVDNLVTSAGAPPPADTKPVLCLLGTRGNQAAWNDRRTSQGHAAIPLLSASFVSGIPMILRMLQQLKAGVDWLDSEDLKQVEATATRLSGLFYVADAAKETDHKGRHVIPAQDFVSRHHVKTVFGIGGGYPTGNIAIVILFTNVALTQNDCKPFKGLINVFKSATMTGVMDHRVFD